MFELVATQLLALSIRITLWLAAAFLLTLVLRRASASVRYWIWVLTLLGVLSLPLLLIAGPNFTVATQPLIVPPQPYSDPSRGARSPSLSALAKSKATYPGLLDRGNEPLLTANALLIPKAGGASFANQEPESTSADSAPTLITSLVLVWGIGAAGVMIYGCGRFHRIWQISHQGERLSGTPWNALLDEITLKLRIRRPVLLVLSKEVAVPMTWGVWHPQILLPGEAQRWSKDRCRVVLVHETIHIARYDALIYWLALVVCALYWFNPLVWAMTKRLTSECEQSCDDLVLSGGAQGVDYADHLVALARSTLKKRTAVPGVLAMAQRSTLSMRVRRILNAHLHRSPLSRSKRWVAALVAMVVVMPLGGLRLAPMLTQADKTIITLAMPDGYEHDIEASLEKFHEQHPNINVVMRPTAFSTIMGTANPATDPEQYYQEKRTLATAADVILISDYSLSAEATRAGLFLNLKPLADADPDLLPDDFYPAAWKLFQWENGLWGLPFTVWTTLVVYDPAAFNALGMAYPGENWTVSDFLRAASVLARYDANHALEVPGFEGDVLPLLASTTPVMLDMESWQDPDVIAQIEDGIALYALNTFAAENGFSPDFDPAGVPLLIDTPMRRLRLDTPFSPPSDEPPPAYAGALLPGGSAEVGGWGFAVSAGTQHPDAAYELVKYMSANPFLMQILPGDRPARPSLYTTPVYAPDIERLIDQGLRNGITPAEKPYWRYFSQVISTTGADAGLDVPARLALAASRIGEASRRSEKELVASPLVIPTPVPTSALRQGEISLRFLYRTGSTVWPSREQWDALIEAFVRQDAEVGQIQFDVSSYSSGEQSIWETYDCAYIGDAYPLFGDFVGLQPPIHELLPLDPLFSVDPEFDPQDFVPGTLEQMRVDEQVYGYPLTIVPSAIWYDSVALEAADVPFPEQGWNVNQFIDALYALRRDPTLPVISGGRDMVDILVAALGGLPIDARSGSWSLNFTDPPTVDAIRQALDLVRDGFLYYVTAGELGFVQEGESPLSLGYLNIMPDVETAFYQNHHATTLPTGTYTPISYRMSGAYISRRSPVPEACYRFIKFLSRHPDVLGSMPAQRSQFNNPAVAGALSRVYPLVAQQFESPNRLVLSDSSSAEGWMARLWLDGVYDTYVKSGGDLEDMLAEAQVKTTEYLACASGVEPLDATPSTSFDVSIAYHRQLQACAVSVDPEMAERFPNLDKGE